MAKFKNKETGVILTTDNNLVVEQLKKNPDYKEVKSTGRSADSKQAQPDAAPDCDNSSDEGADE